MIISLSVFLALFSLLAIFKAPAILFWIPAILATEWGHFFALGCLVLLPFCHRATRAGRVSSCLLMFSAILFLTPVLRASWVALRLPTSFAATFGSESPRKTPDAPARKIPLSATDLFRGVRSPAIRLSSYEYLSSNGDPLALDLYEPVQTDAPLSCVVIIHGGSWKGGNREEIADLNRYLAARGYAVAAIDYHLAPRWTFPVARQDVFAAIRFLKAHAQAFHLDPGKFVLLGRSAGGQIALSAAYAREDPAIRGVVVFYTPNDLVWGYANPSNPLIMNSCKVIEDYLGGPPGRVPGVYEGSSPLRFVDIGTPPTLMIHGGRDELVSPLHEERLSRRLGEFHRPFYYLRLPWATHGCDANFSGPSGQLSTYVIERFLVAIFP